MLPMIANLKKNLKDLHGAQIVVGIQGEAGTNLAGEILSSSEELQKIAWVHEYGMDIEVTPKMRAWLHYNGIHLKKETTHIHIPERSFIRKGQLEGKSKVDSTYNKHIQLLMEGKTDVDGVLKAVGLEMLQQISSGMGQDAAPITQYTLEHRKQSPNPTPLADTGRLHRHLTYRVVKGGGASGSDTTATRSGSE